MKLKQLIDNGNIETLNRINSSDINRRPQNRDWSDIGSLESRGHYDNLNTSETLQYFESNHFRNINNRSGSELLTNSVGTNAADSLRTEASVPSGLVCNQQYRLDKDDDHNFEDLRKKTEFATLEGATESFLTSCESFIANSNVSTLSTPIDDEERAFEHSDTEETSDKGSLPGPRGIVNPNYPGFQHLAHTLQDYSSNIENYYQSENDMTDDDIDVEITDATYESDIKQNEMSIELSNVNNNNNTIITDSLLNNKNDAITEILEEQNNQIHNDIPDLLKTLSHNNNSDTLCFDYNCSATDIENNFNTKDIIGDFNKEIEDEIKHVLNYNINIQDEIEELKKDIQDNVTKPIENTINNISDVVNHVIKKLVATQCDINEYEVNSRHKSDYVDDKSIAEISVKENESNALKEMNQSRPTFLLIESNVNHKIADALLSDGKEEINISEQDYDTDKLSNNVENTIKQLSTELRKIIPKLDELRDREKLFAPNRSGLNSMTITDGNCNQIANASKNTKPYTKRVEKSPKDTVSRSTKENNAPTRKQEFRSRNNPRISKDRQCDLPSSSCYAHNTSVQNIEDCDLGSFDVYNIETALPTLDIDTIESHLRAAKEAERRKRNDREEIRKRLAMGADTEDYYSLGHTDRPLKKPSLQSRLQSGKNLQICFMNETASDNESQTSDAERNLIYNNKNLSKSSIFSKSNYSLNNHPYQTRPLSVNISKNDRISTVQSGAKLRPSSLSLSKKSRSTQSLGHVEVRESDFLALQATLQTEARMALAQAKELARIEMERERRCRSVSPVTEMLRRSMEAAGAPLAPDRRRVSRHLLTDMNIAQLQVIVNALHGEISALNGELVQRLLARDELHMGQDAMLVDIEDLTRYLGVKEQTKKTKGTTKSAVRRLTSFVNK
ncbi:hypothetical protein JYU34_002547 [Plutella xylostella]|uniref:Schwannomin interacting protein 1 C-terminal domain-containing protein n=1 Tax=Plutella xylostella TaxID=51655 RepID=A0ABQ7R2I8_PLUXY|nr:hypothetical protein JYU34_002547 [Plutella xylostella]